MEVRGDLKTRYTKTTVKNFGEHGHVLCGFKTKFDTQLVNLACYTQPFENMPHIEAAVPKRLPRILTRSKSTPQGTHYQFENRLSTINEVESPAI